MTRKRPNNSPHQLTNMVANSDFKVPNLNLDYMSSNNNKEHNDLANGFNTERAQYWTPGGKEPIIKDIKINSTHRCDNIIWLQGPNSQAMQDIYELYN